MEARVDFKTASRLQELGFYQDCKYYYVLKEGRRAKLIEKRRLSIDDRSNTSECILAPNLIQVWGWLEKEKNIHLVVKMSEDGSYHAEFRNTMIGYDVRRNKGVMSDFMRTLMHGVAAAVNRLNK